MAHRIGDSGDNEIVGTVFRDTLEGLGGSDVLAGADADDRLLGGDGNDALYGEQGDDWLEGGADSDRLHGWTGNDKIWGGDGNDTISHSNGDDELHGENGNDIIEFDWNDKIVQGGDGDDQLVAVLEGNVGGSVLPIISGGDGVDTLEFGFVVYGTSEQFDADLSTGIAVFSYTHDIFSILGNHESSLQVFTTSMSGIQNLSGSLGGDMLSGDGGNNVLQGGDGADALYGNGGDDVLWDGFSSYGSDSSADELDGGYGNDIIFSEGGGDTVFGDIGDDTIWVNDPDAVDVDGGADVDTLDVDAYVANAAGYLLGSGGNIAGIEVIRFHDYVRTDGSPDVDLDLDLDIDLDAALGSSPDDFILTVIGGNGDDKFDASRIAGDTTVILEGGEGRDTFESVINGDVTGGDEFHGGDGIDTIDFDEPVLNWGGPSVLLGDGGTITNVEVFNLADGLVNDIELAIPLANSSSTGNITVNGGSGADFVDGGRIGNADVSLFLNGNGGNDVLKGGAGGDTLDGGEDVDTLEGNGGDDTLMSALESMIDGDRFDGGDGIDSLEFKTSVGPLGGSSILVGGGGTVESVEVINLHGSAGSTNDIVLDGNIADTVSFGATIPGAPLPSVIVNGSDADDTVDGSQFDASGTGPVIASLGTPSFTRSVALTFYGGAGADDFIGGSGDDTIHGGISADAMAGGAGDDTYFVDDAGDVVIEATDEGADLVIATTSTVLSENVENLVLVGLGFVNGTGNRLANIIEGSDGVNVLTGLAGDDELYGLSNNDLLWGGLGADVLDGGTGNDTATYAGSNAAVDIDLSADTASGGAAAGDTLDGIENLIGTAFGDVLVGDTAGNSLFGFGDRDVIDGNAGADIINGGDAKDTLDGGGGNDTIFGGDIEDTLNGGSEDDRLIGGLGNDVQVGGSGSDVFVFTDDTEGNDRIDDWAALDDQIEIDASAFGGGLAAGGLAANRLVVGAGPVANQAFGQFLYNTTSGQLSWDADGTGAAAAVAIARLLNGGVAVGALAAADFDIVA